VGGQVLVVRRADFFGGDWPQGFVALAPAAGEELLAALDAAAFPTARAPAEVDPSLKQLIPYCTITCGDETLCVERLRTQGERRLHGLLSIGIGGHVEPRDAGPGRLRRALDRELQEELVLPDLGDPLPTAFLGLLNDDANPVGAVHAGLVFRLAIAPARRAEVGIREISKMAGGFRRLAGSLHLWQDPTRTESWSRILIEGLLSPRRWLGSDLGHDDGREEPHGGTRSEAIS
jgi:predicted NUDIX family phosphoesterase